METQDTINARAARVQQGLEAAFGVRAKTLDAALRRTGRRMPRRLHGAARQIVRAQDLGGHPKQLRQVDAAALNAAETRVLDFLGGIDRADRRKARWIGIGAAIGFNLILAVFLVVTWMVWTGRL